MKDKNKIEIYKQLKEMYPNITDALLILITESNLNLIAGINEDITFPIELFDNSNIKNTDNDFNYEWKILNI